MTILAAAWSPSVSCTTRKFASPSCRVVSRASGQRHLSAAKGSIEQLTAWIEDHGGYVHPTVTLGSSPTFGCSNKVGQNCLTRGVVTTEDIDEELASQEPLLLVPEELSITTALAKRKLGPRLQKAGLPSLEGLDAVLPLALFLAYERKKGQGSFWQPYIGLLPEQPGCAWLMQPQELLHALQDVQKLVGREAENWDVRVKEARAATHAQAERLATKYGKELQVSKEDILWGMGQVLSRCFGQEPDLAMLPFTDLCNHSSHAMAPNSYIGTEDGRLFVFVSSVWDDEPRPLAAGDELFISYMANTPALTAFLNLGFVPEELLLEKSLTS